jgi:hypothetical protein
LGSATAAGPDIEATQRDAPKVEETPHKATATFVIEAAPFILSPGSRSRAYGTLAGSPPYR